jgi:hypothetical protein
MINQQEEEKVEIFLFFSTAISTPKIWSFAGWAHSTKTPEHEWSDLYRRVVYTEYT